MMKMDPGASFREYDDWMPPEWASHSTLILDVGYQWAPQHRQIEHYRDRGSSSVGDEHN
jgi:hypothetical protein